MFSHDLIFDVGMHKGEDSEFYLKKGFRVVGIEAIESFCAAVRDRFPESISTGRLVIVNKAITERPGPVRFYINETNSVWGTLNLAWVERNKRRGAPSREVTVIGIPLEDLIQQHGVPYYLKIDIEGNDLVCLESLRKTGARPRYVSIESTKTSWSDLMREFDLLSVLGYTRFKVVNQSLVPRQIPPIPAREGKAVDHRFTDGASGLFGDEAPGEWLSREEALMQYREIFRRYRLWGDDGVFKRNRFTRWICHLLNVQDSWYDTHAAL